MNAARCPSLTVAQARRVDQLAAEKYGVPTQLLMENAGRNAAALLLSFFQAGRVVLCCGKGNNGGDAFVTARHLAVAGVTAEIHFFGDPQHLSGDALLNWTIAQKLKLPTNVWNDSFDSDRFIELLLGCEWVVDGLLGTGAAGVPREPFPEVIRAINAAGAGGVRVLSLDLPSGLNAETGEPWRDDGGTYGPCIRADLTATFAARKVGFSVPRATEFVGIVHVLDLGIPQSIVDEARQTDSAASV